MTLPDPTQTGTSRMMAVGIRTSPTLRLESPRPLFEFRNQELMFDCTAIRCYDVAPDGQRFFVVQKAGVTEPPPVPHIHLAQSWLDEVKARVPAGR